MEFKDFNGTDQVELWQEAYSVMLYALTYTSNGEEKNIFYDDDPQQVAIR